MSPTDETMRGGFATLVLTSCNRPDFLRQTLQSLITSDLTGIAHIIVIEDSISPQIAPIVDDFLRSGPIPLTYLQNDRNRGQIFSVDRAYAQVETPYVYHCEDDWIFPEGLRLDESRFVLDHNPSVSAILGRNLKKYPRKRIMRQGNRPVIFQAGDAQYVKYDLSVSDSWGGFSFNPGLRRMSDYLALGGYGHIGPEAEISRHYRSLGMYTAFLSGGQVTHIGTKHTVKRDENDFARAGKLTHIFQA